MKILFHINSLGRGGAERVVSVLAGYFANDGYDVTIATLWQDLNEYTLDPKVKRIHVGLKSNEENKNRLYKNIIRINRLRNAIIRENPDIVVSFCASANFRCAYSMYGINIPLLVSVRNDPEKDYIPFKRKNERMIRKASGCVFQTKAAMESFPKDFQAKSRVIYNPLDKKFYDTDKAGKDSSVREKRIVNVGRITKQKNQMLLVMAFERISKDFPDYTLEIYGDSGDGSVQNEIIEFCRNKGIDDKVKFKGVSDTLNEDIRNASLFVLSSDFEGMPNALIEAMALGLPVISTDCPCYGPASLIEQNESGILVPVGDAGVMAQAIKRVLLDCEFANSLGRKAEEIKNIVNPKVIYQEWKQYVEDIERHFKK
jgi:glycosyltransferase involved in cell wall biosynthesis